MKHAAGSWMGLPTLHRGTVKDVLGPIPGAGGGTAAVFAYTDSFSFGSWGRMPDLLAHKGEALAVVASHFFEQIAAPGLWREFSRTPQALALRKANRFGAAFNELGEELQEKGLRTHFLGAITPEGSLSPLAQLATPPRHLLVKQVSIVKPRAETVLGRSVIDYSATRLSVAPRLVPLAFQFRFVSADGKAVDFPEVEIWTKLEAVARRIELGEALAISGLSGKELERVVLGSIWLAGGLRHLLAGSKVQLEAGSFEWGIDAQGRVFLVDALGLDELQMRFAGRLLNWDFLESYYRTTSWHQACQRAREQAEREGSADWKRGALPPPPALSKKFAERAAQLAPAFANHVTGRTWFTGVPSLEHVLAGIAQLEAPRRVAVVGAGAAELAWVARLQLSSQVGAVFAAPGNSAWPANVNRLALDLSDFEGGVACLKENEISVVILGSVERESFGLCDAIARAGIAVFAPTQSAHQIQVHPDLCRDLLNRAGIGMPAHFIELSAEAVLDRLIGLDWSLGRKWSLKVADQIPVICDSLDQAESELKRLSESAAGGIEHSIRIDEVLPGAAIAWFAFTDGNRFALLEPLVELEDEMKVVHPFAPQGPYSQLGAGVEERVRTRFFDPLIRQLALEGAAARGLLGLELRADPITHELKLTGLRTQLSDLEAHSLWTRMEGDLFSWVDACARGDLSELPQRISFRAAPPVVRPVEPILGHLAVGRQVDDVRPN